MFGIEFSKELQFLLAEPLTYFILLFPFSTLITLVIGMIRADMRNLQSAKKK